LAKKKDALVSFFEVCDEVGKPFAEPVDWQGFLEEIAQDPIEERKVPVHGVMTWAEVYSFRGAKHFVLARERDLVSSLNTETGEIIDHDSDANVPWVEISVAHFLPDTNKVAFVLGNNSSPHISSLEEWLNAKRIFEEKVSIQPLLDRNAVKKLKRASSASLVQVSFAPRQTAELSNTGGLFGFARQMQETYGNVTVSLELKIDGRAPRRDSDEAASILDEVKNLAGGTEYQKAIAKIIQVNDQGKERIATLDFLNQRLAKKVKIELANHEKRTVRIMSVLEAIYKAADSLKDDLNSSD
jgi:hypothetical protein